MDLLVKAVDWITDSGFRVILVCALLYSAAFGLVLAIGGDPVYLVGGMLVGVLLGSAR